MNNQITIQDIPQKVVIKGRNIKLTSATKKIIHIKIEKLFHHARDISYLKIIVEYRPNKSHQNRYVVEGHLELEGVFIIVSEYSNDISCSIDHLVDKLDRKLRKHSNKMIQKRCHSHKIDLNANIPKIQMVY